MTDSLATSKTVRLSKRLSVTITVSKTGMVCEWLPERPTKLTAKELRRYRQARDKAVAEIALSLGGSAFVIEV